MNAAKRYSNIDFPFICPISNREFNSSTGLSVYITKTLKMDHSEYYDKYINHRDNSCFFCGSKGKFISASKGYRNLCTQDDCVKKSFNSHSIDGIMYRKMVNREEAEVLYEEENKDQLEKRTITQNKLRKKDPLWDKKRSRNCVEFWLEKGFTETESLIKVTEVMDEIHEKTFKKFKDNKEHYADKQPTRIEYYLKRGYSEKEAKVELINRQTTFSLDKCISKHGEEIGAKIWKERQIKWINTMDSKTDEEKLEILRKKSSYSKNNYSKISQELFWQIHENIGDKNDIYFKELNYEYAEYNERAFLYDFIKLDKKRIIEFNGDYWHCNPIKYDENYYHQHLKMYAKEKWYDDNLRMKMTEKMGYEILNIWESDYRKDKEGTLKKCLNFLQ